MRSLQARLGVGLVAALFLLLGVQWLAVNAVIRDVTEEFVASRLEHDAETILASLNVQAGKEISLKADGVGVYERPFSGHYFRVTAEGQVFHSRSLWDQDLIVPSQLPGESIVLRRNGPLDQPLLVYVSGYRKRGVDVTVAVAEDLSHLEREISEFRWLYGIVSLLALLALIVAQVYTVRRGLQPLERARRQLRELETGVVARLEEDAPAEVRPLVQEINRLVAMLGQRLERSRNALGNLAHALKAPLTLLTQATNSPELHDHPELGERLRAHTATIRELMERELKRARLAGGAAPGRHFEVKREIPPLVEMLKNIHREKHLAFDVRFPDSGGTYAVDREDMLELFGNLLDNACKWARSRVVLSVQPGPDLHFSVEDDGPGVVPDKMEQLATRGVRIDESTAGHGLGLAIVRDTVDDYDGDMRIGTSTGLGGFRVEIVIPLPVRTEV